MRVLLVHPDPASISNLRTALQSAGHNVMITDRGEEAIRLALRERPDAVIIELRLPMVDGFQVARVLTTYAPLKDIFLLALASDRAPEDEALSADAGFAACLAAPVDPQALLREIERSTRRTNPDSMGDKSPMTNRRGR